LDLGRDRGADRLEQIKNVLEWISAILCTGLGIWNVTALIRGSGTADKRAIAALSSQLA
jgi:hypothetical protein